MSSRSSGPPQNYGSTGVSGENQEIFVGVNEPDYVDAAIVDSMEARELYYTAHNLHTHHRHNLSMYWKCILFIAIFYGLPSIQFVIYQVRERLGPDQEFCYYNFKCNMVFHGVEAFNNIVSNLAYILLAVAFALIVRYRAVPHDQDLTGLHQEGALYYALSLGLGLEGVFSALYHVCPTALNFQFDSTFMFICGILLIVTMYHKRHPTGVLDPMKAYSLCGIFVLFNVLDISTKTDSSGQREANDGKRWWYWALVLVAYILTSIYTTASIYFGRNDWLKECLICHRVRTVLLTKEGFKIDRKSRFWRALGVNVVNYGVLAAGMARQPAFTDFLLGVLIVNLGLYMVYYLYMKIKVKEAVRWWAWVLMLAMFGSAGGALWFFTRPTTDKLEDWKASLELNTPCVLFGYFDTHDVWHFMSAVALFLMFLFVYVVDLPEQHRSRSDIAVF